MKNWAIGTIGMLLMAMLAVGAVAADRVRLVQGTSSIGRLTEITANELTLESSATTKTIPVNEVELVNFDSEPTELAQARVAAHAGRYEDALTLLGKINADSVVRPEVASDIEYYKAFCAARLALAGVGSKAEAGRSLLNFEKAHKTSLHYYQACATLGDLLVALGKFDQEKDGKTLAGAESYYNKLAEAPWPEYKQRAALLVGRALIARKQFEAAIDKFDEVLASTAEGKEAEQNKLAAALGKASAMAGAGKTDEAIKSIEDIIAKADPENQELHARAYNALGNCFKAAGKIKEAIIAYLHVDLLYARFPEQHAEALANLATLFAEDGKNDRAAQARAMLKEKYPTSVWAADLK